MSPATRDGLGRTPGWIRALRWIVLALLLVSAALTLLALPELRDAVAAGRWPRAALALPVAIIGLFIVGYAVYRFALVRAGRYSAGKALVQLGLMLLVLGVIGGIALERGREGDAGVEPVDLGAALHALDADMRAMAVELVRHRPREVAVRHVDRLIELLDDPAPEVRRQAHATLVALAGADVGGDDADAAERWRAYWREREGAVR